MCLFNALTAAMAQGLTGHEKKLYSFFYRWNTDDEFAAFAAF
jgi:hypothetical protein